MKPRLMRPRTNRPGSNPRRTGLSLTRSGLALDRSLPAGLALLLRDAGFGQAAAAGHRAEQRLRLWCCRFHDPDVGQVDPRVERRKVGGEIADLDLDSLSWASGMPHRARFLN